MKIQELRIGNYVFDNLGGVLKIKGLSLASDISHLRPIDLDDNWLEKFGMEDGIENEHFKFMAVYNDGWNIYFEEKEGYGNARFSSTGFYSVHEFQNLFYAMTGLELAIKNQNE
jgi:hypothetical protein